MDTAPKSARVSINTKLTPPISQGRDIGNATLLTGDWTADQRVAAFVANNSDATLLPSPGYILPGAQGTGAELGDNGAREDGFFYALLEKHSD